MESVIDCTNSTTEGSTSDGGELPSFTLASMPRTRRFGFRVFPAQSGTIPRRDSTFGGDKTRIVSPCQSLAAMSGSGVFDTSSDEVYNKLPCSPLSIGGGGISCKSPNTVSGQESTCFFQSSPSGKPRRSIASVSNTARRRSVTLTPLKLSSSITNANLRTDCIVPSVNSGSPTLGGGIQTITPDGISPRLRRISIASSPSSAASSPRSPLSQVIPNVPNNVLEFLEGMAWLEEAPLEVKTKVASVAQVRPMHQGEIVIRKGEEAKAIFFVARGLVEVISEDSEVIYAEIGEGSIFGEIGILFDMPRTCSCRAGTNVLLLAVKKDEFLSILGEEPALKEKIVAEANERLQIIAHRTKGLRSSFAIGKDYSFCSLAEHLLSFPVFHILERQAINQISLLIESASYKQSDDILSTVESTSYDSLFMLTQGEIEVTSYSTTDCTTVLSRELVSAGSMFGNVLAFFPHEPIPTQDDIFTHVARASAACEVLKLPFEPFREFLLKNEDVAAAISEEILGVTTRTRLAPSDRLTSMSIEDEDPMIS